MINTKKEMLKLILSLIFIIGSFILIFCLFNYTSIARDLRFTTIRGHSTAVTTTIIVDNETGVMYLWCERDYKAGVTVMLDKDGKPLIHKESEK